MLKTPYLTFLLFSFLFCSCAKNSDSNLNPGPDPIEADSAAKVDVYVAGTVGVEGNRKAVYWKNDSMVDLSDRGSANLASGIVVSGSDVYVSGLRDSNIGYWKNGTFVSFNTVDPYGLPKVELAGIDVYLLINPEIAGNMHLQYFKNNQLVPLLPDTLISLAAGIVINGSDVYIAGSIIKGNIREAVYWKNGNIVYLTNGTQNSKTTGITIFGPDVYICGGIQNADGAFQSVYWKNGTMVNLSGGKNYEYANDISLSRGDVYVVAMEQDGTTGNSGNLLVKYYKNGIPVNLTDFSTRHVPRSISLNGSDVYISLTEESAGSVQRAKYSKNAKMINLGDGIEPTAAWDLFLVKRF